MRPHTHQRGGRKEEFAPLISVFEANNPDRLLSFYNAIEAHVLLAARRDYHVTMLGMSRAVAWIRDKMPSRYPLADYQFSVKGKHLFLEALRANPTVEEDGEDKRIADASQFGQRIIPSVLDLYLKRIDRDPAGNGFRFFPVVPKSAGETHPVMMDIHFSSGKLVVSHTGVLASVLHGKYCAGQSVEKLSRDYKLSPEQILGAVDYLQTAA